jgi:hypothetical protein
MFWRAVPATLFLALGCSLAPAQSVTLTTFPQTAALGQHLQIILDNRTPNTVGLPTPAPWSIHDSASRVVFSPITIQIPVSLPPFQSKKWTWDQKDMNLAQVAPGAYEARLRYFTTTGPIDLKAPFTIDSAVLSVSSQPTPGATVRFGLSAPRAPGRVYQVALSFGTSPGIPLAGGRLIPLNVDHLLFASLTVGPPLFNQFLGVLDRSGTGAARLAVPNQSALIGVRFHTGFAAFDHPAPGGVLTFSDAVPLQIK